MATCEYQVCISKFHSKKLHGSTSFEFFILSSPQACNLIVKETPTQVFSFEFCEILRTPFLQCTTTRLHAVTAALCTPHILGTVRRFQIWKFEFCHSHQFSGNNNDGNDKDNRQNCSYQLYWKSSELWHFLAMCNIYAKLAVSTLEQGHWHCLILKFPLLRALGKCVAV